jgi:hypothetical protein
MILVMHTKTLGEFILSAMQMRQMSARAFARFVGVDSKTINGYPSVEFLLKLSEATKADICYLMTLLGPNISANIQSDPEALALSRQIEEQPPHIRDAIDALILGAALNSRKDSE